jgi:hypothetical protein
LKRERRKKGKRQKAKGKSEEKRKEKSTVGSQQWHIGSWQRIKTSKF